MTLVELAWGKFPFPPEGKPLSVFELLEYIIHEPVPTLPPGYNAPELDAFIARWYVFVFRMGCFGIMVGDRSVFRSGDGVRPI